VQITQALVNLLENATKYAPAGTTVCLGVRRVGREVAVAVADEGPGLLSWPRITSARESATMVAAARAQGREHSADGVCRGSAVLRAADFEGERRTVRDPERRQNPGEPCQ
jgi:K+-sensing histidine kinase KdpD